MEPCSNQLLHETCQPALLCTVAVLQKYLTGKRRALIPGACSQIAVAHAVDRSRVITTLQSIARIRSAAAITVHAHTVKAKGVALFPTESSSRIHGNAPCRFVKWVKQNVAAILGQVANV